MVAHSIHNDEARITVAKEFSKYPGGRHRTDGPWSGEEFREEKLKPLLLRGQTVVIDFTGVFTVAPSFMDEAFGPFMESLGRDGFDRSVKIIAEDDPDVLSDLQTIREIRFNS